MSETFPEASVATKTSPTSSEKPMLTLRDLQKAVRDLLFSSESDEPVKAVSLTPETFGATEVNAKTVAGYRHAVPEIVKTLTVEEFFAPMITPQDWWTDENKATATQFEALAKLLTERLTDVKAYRIGDGPEIEVLVLGKNEDGKILGVRTELTET
jgi:hypothetical protein